MLSFLTSQAIAVSQSKQRLRSPRAHAVASDQAPLKRFLSRVLDALSKRAWQSKMSANLPAKGRAK